MRNLISFLMILAMAVPCFASLRADLNGDRRVDFQDFTILASEWMCDDMGDYSLKFNGINQYATVANNDALNVGTGDFSISFQMKILSNTACYLVSKKQTGGSLGWRIQFSSVTQRILLTMVDTDGHYRQIYSNAVTVGMWTHICFTVDRDGYGIGYANAIAGTPVADMSIADKTLSHTEVLIIGALDPQNPSSFAPVLIDDIRIYKDYDAVSGALTQEEVSEICNGGAGRKYAALASGKVASWASDCDLGADPDVLYDAVGTVHGTLTGNSENNMWEAGGVPFALPSQFNGNIGAYGSGFPVYAEAYRQWALKKKIKRQL